MKSKDGAELEEKKQCDSALFRMKLHRTSMQYDKECAVKHTHVRNV